MFTLIILATIAWFTYRHLSNKKRAADIKNWGIDFRKPGIRRIARRLPWKDL